ncbi:MAG: hypothetical protein WA354_14645, partial [Terracidiphilus sp.]
DWIRAASSLAVPANRNVLVRPDRHGVATYEKTPAQFILTGRSSIAIEKRDLIKPLPTVVASDNLWSKGLVSHSHLLLFLFLERVYRLQ